MSIDWLRSSEDQRKRLYVATRAIASAANLSIDEIMDAAMGRKMLMGTDYISNFRRGKIRRSYAKLIYEWLERHHGEIANRLAPDLFPLTPLTAWEQLIEARGIEGQLNAIPIPKRMGLTRRRANVPTPATELRLNQDYCFQLDSDMEGYAVGFEGYRGEWHALPLGADDRHPTAKIIQGRQFVPSDERGNPIPLVETDDIGLHQFVVVVVMADLAGGIDIDALTERHASTPMQVHSLRVRFVA
ncbi:MAG: hypothetical protein AAF367_01425 [Pseudomonadota bacterium]